MRTLVSTFLWILVSSPGPLLANKIQIWHDSTTLPANVRCLIKIEGKQLFYGACNYDGLVLSDRRLVIACPKHNCIGASTYIVQNGNFFHITSPHSVPEGSGSNEPIFWNHGEARKAHTRLDGFIREGSCWANHRSDSRICIDKL